LTIHVSVGQLELALGESQGGCEDRDHRP
jgi:hypothetical protein